MNNIQVSVYLSEKEVRVLDELTNKGYNKSSAVREGLCLLYESVTKEEKNNNAKD